MNIRELNVIHFPDGHLHIKDFSEDNTLYASIKSFDDLFLIAQAKRIMPHITTLVINYLLCARCDRRFSDKESFDLEIVSDFINHMNFDSVKILKPHSPVSIRLINNSTELSVTSDLVQQCIIHNQLTDYSIISPDKGASIWITRELGSTDVIQCDKKRDLESGEVISVKFTDTPKSDCIIVDDLCDGGRTFIELSTELKSRGVNRVYLVVTHGIFSKGVDVFDGYIEKIYCTDSFEKFLNNKLTQVNIQHG